MKNNLKSGKKPVMKGKKKRLTGKETISVLLRLLAKDVKQAKLDTRLEQKIIKQLSRVLSQVDQTLTIFPNCKCYETSPPFAYLGCFSMANCYKIGGTCVGPC